MRPELIPIEAGADPRQLARARCIVNVKFVGMPPPPPRGGVQRFLFRVIDCLVAARP
ncbi:MAG TPA: hypothetical protein VN598_01400 [Usitatibacter sp.]|nr:hypothetical protein [Usitatibacter sp.]